MAKSVVYVVNTTNFLKNTTIKKRVKMSVGIKEAKK